MSRVLPQVVKRLPVIIGGSSKFGRYPKISEEKTFNMYISEKWLIPTPGHIKVAVIDPEAEGRGLFTSARGGFMLVVIGNGVYKISAEIQKIGRDIPITDPPIQLGVKIGSLDTYTGDVFIDENDAEQIGICDKKDIYIYDYQNTTFTKATLDFLPGYIAFQDGYFIAPDSERPQWRLSAINNGLSWPASASSVGELQTKPDNAKACVRVPGKGNQLFIMGSTVTESWNDIGYKLFPYYRTNSFNIDYGCINQATIATSDRFVIWLASNEKSSPVIMYSDGGPPVQVSTDGINFALANLSKPSDAYGFLFKSDGHLFYQLTFNTDNLTFLYDFNTNFFFFLSDAKMENHIAKKVTFFAEDYYFISLIDGNLYRLDSDITTHDGALVPRVRVTNTIRLPGAETFIGREMSFTIAQGDAAGINRVDTSISYDGGETFSNIFGTELNPLGKRRNRFRLHQLGLMNSCTFQFRFWGESRFTCTDGYLEAYR